MSKADNDHNYHDKPAPRLPLRVSIRGDRFTIDGETYPLAKTSCTGCFNWIIHPNLPEFDPVFCAYCGTEYDRRFDVTTGNELNPNGTRKT